MADNWSSKTIVTKIVTIVELRLIYRTKTVPYSLTVVTNL